jgi:hypothetical protein
MLLLIAGVGVAAFFAGRYQGNREAAAAAAAIPPAPQPTATPLSPEAEFDQRRRAVDRDPAGSASRMEADNTAKPLDTLDPESLYLYGRALLLSNRHEDASRVFRLALDKMKDRPARDPLKVEVKMTAAAAAVRSNNQAATQAASKELEEVLDMANKTVPPSSNINGPSGVSNTGEAPPAFPQH